MKMKKLDDHPIEIKEREILVCSCVRNERLRLPYFLKYHRNLGVDRFLFIDNASTDGTAEYLLSEENVHIFYTAESYAESRCGIDWINHLLSRFGVGHWVLTLDADELIVFPYSETIGLKTLVEYLEKVEADGLVTFLLDMYSDKSIQETHYEPGQTFTAVCRYFDADSYIQFDENAIPVRGGPRHRLFWQGRDRLKPSPVLKKIPLVKWREGLFYEASTHVISNVRTAPVTGILQHFKLFSDFYPRARVESQRKEHWDNAAQYDCYWDVLRKYPALTPIYEGSRRYENSLQFVGLGLMRMPDDYTAFLANRFPAMKPSDEPASRHLKD
ncbi:MAG: glycosyltransferase family 2 protein [Gammaproteobacteria bacterium]